MILGNRHLVEKCWHVILPLTLFFIAQFSIPSAHADDFGIVTSENSVTVKQNQFSSPLNLTVKRDDFDGPVEIDVDVKGGGRDVQAYVSDREKIQEGSAESRDVSIYVGTGRDVENGSYEVTVTATGTVNGEPRTRVATFIINVQREGDTFEIGVNPNTITIPQGGTGSTKVEVKESGSFSERVYLEVRQRTSQDFSFSFSGANAGEYAAANHSDVMIGSQHWITQPDANGQSQSTLNIKVAPDVPPGEYTFEVHGRRDQKQTVDTVVSGTRETKAVEIDKISKRRAVFTVVVTADPDYISLIEPTEFDIEPGVYEMLTPPSSRFYLNQMYISATRDRNLIKTSVQLENPAAGIAVSMMRNKNINGVKIHYLRVDVSDEAKPGTYYANVTATATGTNNKSSSKSVRIEIIVPDNNKNEDTKISISKEPDPVKINCVGNSCPSEPIDANCLGNNCAPTTILNCSGSLCPQSMDILCPSGNCPTVIDLNCDEINCDLNGMTFFCGEGGCAAQPGGNFIGNLNEIFPSNLNVNCVGQGCAEGEDILGLCYGSECPNSINLNCSGGGCTNTLELNCSGTACPQDFTYDCVGGFCSSQLQFDCDGSICDQLDSFPDSRPYLTGAAPSGGGLFVDGFESGNLSTWSTPGSGTGSGTNNAGSQPGNIQTITLPRGSSDAIPAGSSDLAAIRAAANAISANAGVCLDAECPIIDCATAGRLLQGLIEAEGNLDEMYKWLIQASDDAMAHFQSLSAQGIITSEMMAQAQTAQAVHKYLHDIGSLMLDLAALGEFYKKFKDGDFADGSVLERLDGTYEMLKDLESATSTLGDAYDVEVPTVVSDVPGAAIGAAGGDGAAAATGLQNATPEALGSAVNDMKSQINDAIDIIKDAKDGKTPTAAVGKAIGRILKTYSSGIMQERERLINEYIANNTALYGDPNNPNEVSPVASSYAFLQKVNSRRFATEDALKAIRAAKDALMACMAKACDAVSLTRANVNSSFNGWGLALRHFNGVMQTLFSGLNGSFSVRDHCPGTETAISLFTGDGFLGGSGVSIGGNPITISPAREPKTAKCPDCQSRADAINTNLSETDYWQSERNAIEEKLTQAETLRQRMEILESRKASNRRSIQQMTQGLKDSVAFGVEWGPGLSLMLKEAEIRGRDLTRQIQEMQREIDRLEADKNRLPNIRERLSQLRQQRPGLYRALEDCEEQYCKESQYDEEFENVGKFFAEILDVEVIDVKTVSGNNPFDRENPLNHEHDDEEGGTGTTTTPGATVQVINNIPISRLTLAGPDACPSNHYHGNANNCNGLFTVDPAPGVCGHGVQSAVTSIPVSSCPDL